MSNQAVSGSRWWLPVLAFAAGIAFHAAASGHHTQTLTAEPTRMVATPASYQGNAPDAQAGTDTCEVQQD